VENRAGRPRATDIGAKGMSGISPGLVMWTYRRPFKVDDRPALVTLKSGMKGLLSTLSLDGMELSHDFTPSAGADAARNHRHAVTLPDGRLLEVEAGYCSWTDVAVAARLDGAMIHESHPGRAIRLPERARKMMTETTPDGDPALDYGKLSQNRVPIAVDVITGLLFFVVAKLTDLTTAALVGAGVGLALIVAQRLVKVDLLGGLAIFGVIMLLISAGFAWAFQDEDIIKLRSTIVGLIGAAAFLVDGLFGGRWLGKGLSRYIAYRDIDPRRLAIGLGLVGIGMAAANWVVVQVASTDVWLFYTTFVDIFLSMGLVLIAVRWARQPGRAA
jgi:intracellular septation protein A